jgi:TRAP-type C4-dicarboxylate transport system substrate-binding protein
MKIQLKTTALIAALLLATGATSINAAELKLRANTFLPPETPLAKYGYISWKENVEKLSNGEISVQVFPGGVLLPPRAGGTGVRDGIADVGMYLTAYTPSEAPLTNALQELGPEFQDPLVPMVAITDLSMTSDALKNEYKKQGIVFTGGLHTPPYNLFCNKPIQTLDDLKGKKIRTPGGAFAAWAQSVGATPVNVPSPEMYSGLDKGALDCAANAGDELKSRSLWDVAKHTMKNVPGGVYFTGPMWAFNERVWRKMTPEQRQIIFQANAIGMAQLYVGYQAAANAAFEEAIGKGVTFHQPDATILQDLEKFQATTPSRFKEVATKTYRVENPDSLLAEFKDRVKKWDALFANVDKKDSAAIAKIIQAELYNKVDPKTYGVN